MRDIQIAVLAACAALAACAGAPTASVCTTAPGTLSVGSPACPPAIPASVIAQTQAMVTGLNAMVQEINVSDPTLIPPAQMTVITKDLADAQQALSLLHAGMSASLGAVIVQQAAGDVNSLLVVLAAPPINGLLPPPFGVAAKAAAIIAPLLEAYVQQYVPTAAANPQQMDATATFRATYPAIETPDQALAAMRQIQAAR